MRRIMLNKWFVIAVLLMISLSAFSVVAYKKTRELSSPESVNQVSTGRFQKGEMIWDVLSGQFTPVSLQ